jgi:multicomponent Na+:H+ antiporter subunit D
MPADSPWLALPLILPLFATGLLLLLRRAHENVRHAINITTCAAMLVSSFVLFAKVSGHGVLVLRAGNWPAPFGISLVADLFSAAMVLVTAVIGFTVAVYAAGSGTAKFRGYFTPLYLALLMGVNGSFLTGDLFNLYVWFEVMLMSSFVLVALPGGRPQLEAAVKYLTLNFIASAFFLVGLGVLYGLAGTLNMADLAVKLAEPDDANVITSSAVLFLIAFGVKAGIFPFYFWLPSSYHVTPTPVAAVFAGLLTKVGVYACVRVFTLVYSGHQEFIASILLPLGILTMITGVLGAASQFFIPRILSFHIISQIGYMIVGLAFFTKAALAATVFYIIHHILVKSNLFLIGGIIGRKQGTQALEKNGGLYRSAPWLAILFLIPAMSLGGIPPLSGFFAKFALIREGLALGQWTAVFAASAVGLLTLYSMIKIWNEAFWKNSPIGDARPVGRAGFAMVAPAVLLACCTIAFGLFPAYFLTFAERAAAQLMDPAEYIRAVLGTQPQTVAEP